ncbi:hypothetical protein [Enterococcus alishanensis]
MTKTMTVTKYQMVKEELLAFHRPIVHMTKKEFDLIMTATVTGNWQPVYETRIYIKYGGEYCSILQVIDYLFE